MGKEARVAFIGERSAGAGGEPCSASVAAVGKEVEGGKRGGHQGRGGDGVGGGEDVVSETAKINKPECEEAVASVERCGILQRKRQGDIGQELVQFSTVAI